MTLIRFIFWNKDYRIVVPLCFFAALGLLAWADACLDGVWGVFLVAFAPVLFLAPIVGAYVHLCRLRALLYEGELRRMNEHAAAYPAKVVEAAIGDIRERPWEQF
jgi:hypothetical protein